jgi:ppGpp synthetase/RelA/SpoT-type nucleotidyltranferase
MGKVLRNANLKKISSGELDEAMKVVSYWRFSHEEPLKVAMVLLQKSVKPIDSTAVFAKRRKRIQSIVKKLQRFKDMSLKNMNDIGGCRVILSNEKNLRKAVESLRTHENYFGLNAKTTYKDYIETPKADGYRGYHLIGKFSAPGEKSRLIEIQLRTVIQHSWATSLEIVDIFTNQTLKLNSGKPDWARYFTDVSKLFAVIEKIKSKKKFDPETLQMKYGKALERDVELEVLHRSVRALGKKLHITERFHAFAASMKIIDDQSWVDSAVPSSYVLLDINIKDGNLSGHIYSREESADAEKAYTDKELSSRNDNNIIIALVSTTAIGGIKEAFPNYFADATEFLSHISLIESISFDKPKPLFLSQIIRYIGDAKFGRH